MRSLGALVVIGAGLLASGCSSEAAPSSGEVEIETTADASNAPEIVGTLEVTEGADVLGCESATTERTATPDDPEGRPVDVFTATCETGTRQGTFDVSYVGETEDSGTWEITGATDDFAGLAGSGDFTVDYTQAGSPGMLTGSMSYPAD